MPRIDATPHPMMAAHEVDPMAAITRAHIDGLGVRWRCCGNIRLSGNARRRWLRWSFRLGRGGRRRRPDYWNRMNGSRQIGKLLQQRTPAAPMIPPSLGLRLPAAVTRGATKAHDEVWQRTRAPPRPASHQRLLARCSLRTPPCDGYKCRRAFCDDKHDLFDVDPTNNIQARRLWIAVSCSRLNAALNKQWKIGYVR
jgi:hypothetical protein